jgi:PHD/YefM family antitoxin component YafN of YafNO toxin-antitoxin module
MTPKMEPIEDLAHLPASDVKKRGWRGVMRTLSLKGKVVVTNHNQPEAVIIPAQEYSRLLQIVKQVESRTESELETLRRRFDDRLAALQAPEAGDRLRSVMRGPARLGGKVKAGSSY